MAEWSVRTGNRNCEHCRELTNIDSFPKGVNVQVNLDCENCPVFKSQPIWENEIILDLYSALPSNYEGMSGLRWISASDIKFIFDLFDILPELREDYYNRIIFFHTQLIVAKGKVEKKKNLSTKGK